MTEKLQDKFLERFKSSTDRVISYTAFLELTQGADSAESAEMW